MVQGLTVGVLLNIGFDTGQNKPTLAMQWCSQPRTNSTLSEAALAAIYKIHAQRHSDDTQNSTQSPFKNSCAGIFKIRQIWYFDFFLLFILYFVVMGSSWIFLARASPSYEVSEPSLAELGHFNFRAETELKFF